MPGNHLPNAAPEIRLLVSCARTRISPDLAKEIRSLVAGHVDWDRVVSAAAQNAVAPLLERQLNAVAPGAMASPQRDRLTAMNREGALRSLKLTAALLEILEALEPHGVAAIPYKGPVLALQSPSRAALCEASSHKHCTESS